MPELLEEGWIKKFINRQTELYRTKQAMVLRRVWRMFYQGSKDYIGWDGRIASLKILLAVLICWTGSKRFS